MMNENPLTLKEKYLLLAYHPERGRPLSRYLAFGLAGAILLELADMGKITLNRKRLILSDARKTSDPVLDLVIEEIGASKSSKRLATWINRFVRFRFRRKLRTMVLEEMIGKRIIKKEEARILIFFRYYKYLPYETKLRNEQQFSN